MKEAASIIKQIGATSSINDKLSLLGKHAHNQTLKEILRFIYNPYCKTGISDAKLNKFGCVAYGEIPDRRWPDAIKYFSTHQTGTDADVMFACEFISNTVLQYGEDAAQLARAMVTQNLKIGITATSLNKVYGSDFIPFEQWK